MDERVNLTDLIHRAEKGDAEASDRLFAETYADLRKLARRRLMCDRRTSLDTAALVHESYLRFAASGRLHLEDRVHFIRWAGQVMRSVIVDFARRRSAARRGGGRTLHVTLTTGLADGHGGNAEEILRVHEALDEIAAFDARLAKVVELRYFGGLTEPEIAQALGVTDRTVRRDWQKARLLLRRALQ